MWDLFLRLTLSGIMSGIIGFEREKRSKDAGLKTHFLVGIGSTLIMIVSKYGFYDILGTKGVALDPARIAAQVVSGIGFLGAGTIILEKHYIRGLTSAAGIWATAGIGLALGAGMYTVGIFSTALVLIGLEILNRIFRNTLCKYIEIIVWTTYEGLVEIEKTIYNGDFPVVDFESKRDFLYESKDSIKIRARLKLGYKDNPYKLVTKLYKYKEILKVEINTL